jgi:hypothetical protein
MERKCSSCIRVERDRLQSHVLGKVFLLSYARKWQRFSRRIFFGGLKCVGHYFAYVAHFVFLRDVWIQLRERSQQAGAIPT